MVSVLIFAAAIIEIVGTSARAVRTVEYDDTDYASSDRQTPLHLTARMIAAALEAGSDLIGALTILRGHQVCLDEPKPERKETDALWIDCGDVADGLLAGRSWDSLWHHAGETLKQLTDLLYTHWIYGIPISEPIRAWAIQQGKAHEQRVRMRAVRLAVWLVVPLGVCFLPAFVCIAIIPMVIAGLL